MAKAPEAAPKKKYISPSQVNLYTNCAEAYRRRYVEGEKIPPGVAALRGSSIHRGAEMNFAQKIDSHVDLPKSQIVERAAAEFDARIKLDGVFMSDEDVSRGKAIVLGEEKDITVRLSGLLADEVAPLYQPTAVEQTQRIELPNSPRDILGILDLSAYEVSDADKKVGIVDWKSGKRTKPQSDFDTSIALSIYGLTFRAKHGIAPAFTAVEQLVDTKVPKRVRNTTERTTRDFEVAVARINAVIDGSEKGVFTPASPGSWMCSTRFCGYARSCAYYNAERKIASDSVNMLK